MGNALCDGFDFPRGGGGGGDGRYPVNAAEIIDSSRCLLGGVKSSPDPRRPPLTRFLLAAFEIAGEIYKWAYYFISLCVCYVE